MDALPLHHKCLYKTTCLKQFILLMPLSYARSKSWYFSSNNKRVKAGSAIYRLFHPQGGSQEGRRTMTIVAATLSPMRRGRRGWGTMNNMPLKFQS